MATVKQPKSILKKPPAVPTKADRDLETARYHAALIQQRKDIELQILLSTERMLDFPLSPLSTAANPSPPDVALFKENLQLFQPGDYDCLIQERRIDERCGYVLCPNRRAKDAQRGKYRLLNKSGRAADFRIVPTEELEMWCSEDCARRAMYVKLQLGERPAWERAASAVQIELLGETKTELQIREERLAEDLRNLNLRNEEMGYQDAGDLALERGDRGAAAVNGRVGVSINERKVANVAVPPSLDVDDVDGRMEDMHLAVEGYHSKFDINKMDTAS